VLAVETAIGRRDLDRVRALLHRDAGQPAEHPWPFAVAQRLRLDAMLMIADGEAEGVDERLLGAIDLFRQVAFPFWIARTLLDRSEWLTAAGREEEAARDMDESRLIFQQLGARAWLDRTGRPDAALPAAAAGITAG
jgi:hypothetical protein